ncbi:hypothetical protein B0H63DRAFT_190032 [Podospora didyma]|uniref:Secreted protein n=1 Tax=Podospora didyma TaxID=330526 RepID=A0AAE0NQQ5_9PEZI|nr:hypothetical protein B0H63DRAFT_190032 [Podospora didyma]
MGLGSCSLLLLLFPCRVLSCPRSASVAVPQRASVLNPAPISISPPPLTQTVSQPRQAGRPSPSWSGFGCCCSARGCGPNPPKAHSAASAVQCPSQNPTNTCPVNPLHCTLHCLCLHTAHPRRD